MIIIVGLRPRPRRPHHGARFGGIEAPGFCFIQSGSSRIRFTCIYIYIYIYMYTHISLFESYTSFLDFMTCSCSATIENTKTVLTKRRLSKEDCLARNAPVL